jgi:hypothetical protein
VIVIASPFRLDVSVDGIGDPLVGSTGLMLVYDRGPFTVVAHPCHQIPEASTAVGRELVTSVPEIMKMQAREADRPTTRPPQPTAQTTAGSYRAPSGGPIFGLAARRASLGDCFVSMARHRFARDRRLSGRQVCQA